jgi:glycosyltransferase involved in cell wall biosynthesis
MGYVRWDRAMTDADVRQLANVTTIVINYRTADLTQKCVESFLRHYPNVRLLLIDNGSNDDSTAYIRYTARDHANVTCIINEMNLYHGPALDQGTRSSDTDYVFTLDSDCEVLRGGFLEEMLELFQDPHLYAVGKLAYMNKYGFETEAGSRGKVIKYVYPYAMLLDRDKYLKLERFTHHGSPSLRNMEDAEERGYQVSDFPIAEFILHRWKGTCSRYGYGLGPRTSLEKLLSKLRVFV